MASLLPPQSAADSGRISQFLPSVKCSNCNQLVPISELEAHSCTSAPVPSVSASSSLSSFLPQRLQTLVSLQRSGSPKPPSTPPRESKASRRSRALSFGSKKANTLATPPTPSPPPPPVRPARAPSPLNVVNRPPRKDSRDSYLSSAPSSRTKSPAPSQHFPPVPFPVHASTLSVSQSRNRTPSVTSSSNSGGSRPSIDVFRNRTSSAASQNQPSTDSSRSRNISTTTTSSNGRLSFENNLRVRTPDNSQFLPTIQSSPSNNSILSNRSDDDNRLSASQNNEPSVLPFRPPTVQTPIPYEQPLPSRQRQQSYRQEEPDTKIGGEAGMAGVGRRGFQAAARAAFLTVSDRRRPNAPELLDIGLAINATNTPPLSPSGYSSSHSPLSPFSQTSPDSAGYSPALPTGGSVFDGHTTPRNPAIASSRTPSPTSPGRSPFSERSISTPLPSAEDLNRSPSVAVKDLSRSNDDYDERPISPMTESDYGGLAYASSVDDGEDHEINDSHRKSVDGRTSRIEFPSLSPRSKTSSISVYSPRVPAKSLSIATSISDYTPRTTSKSTGALDRAMETLFEDLPPSPTDSVSASDHAQPNHPCLASAPDGHNVLRDSSSRPKLPTRARTSPTMGKSRHDSHEGKKAARSATTASSSSNISSKYKSCVGCSQSVRDGKWIPMDGGGVLCDRCWKNMYLPKCRRCNQPIEKQAVSSSDGQLKGKYHRDCFNCHTCYKPFPDRTFYVFDGKPFCAYHYHEADGSLCAAPTCGQPIEGPCAVSHSGDKYHPDHLVCDYPRCTENLEEYWEVDGRMLCELHMQMEEDAAIRGGKDLVDDMLLELNVNTDNFRNSVRAMKRVTRFIDIAGLGISGPR